MLPTIRHRQAIKLVMDPWTLAQAKIGQWSLGLEKNITGRPSKKSTRGVVDLTKAEQVKAAGYTQQAMHKREQIAQIPSEEFEEYVSGEVIENEAFHISAPPGETQKGGALCKRVKQEF